MWQYLCHLSSARIGVLSIQSIGSATITQHFWTIQLHTSIQLCAFRMTTFKYYNKIKFFAKSTLLVSSCRLSQQIPMFIRHYSRKQQPEGGATSEKEEEGWADIAWGDWERKEQRSGRSPWGKTHYHCLLSCVPIDSSCLILIHLRRNWSWMLLMCRSHNNCKKNRCKYDRSVFHSF